MTDLTTGVHTSVVDDLADLVSAAVSVLLTLHLGAAQGLVGVADMFVQTPTLRPVVDHHTLGVGATLGPVTGVDTLPVAAAVPSTGQTVSTVSVGPTLIGIISQAYKHTLENTSTDNEVRGTRVEEKCKALL